MAVLKIVQVPGETLRKKSKPVKKIDKKIKTLIRDMWETLEAQDDPEGVGLAAPQVGKNLQIFILMHNGKKRTVINPKVLEVSKKPKKLSKKEEKNIPMEGCLSLPHYYGPLVRPKRVKIVYTNERGQEVAEEFKSFMAQIILHELDHLNGIMFVDHIVEQEVPLYKLSGDEWEKVDLP